MKHLGTIVLAGLMAGLLTACGQEAPKPTEVKVDAQGAPAAQAEPAAKAEPAAAQSEPAATH